MPIEFFRQHDEVSSLDFLADALEENPKLNGRIFDVQSFKKAKSGKGYMLYTSDFICWLFKKEKVMQQALEALDIFCKNNEGYQFVVQVDKKLKNKFVLGIDHDRRANYIPLENMSYVSVNNAELVDTIQTKKQENPFLLKKSTLSLTTPTAIDPLNNGEPTTPTIPQGKKGQGVTK